MSLLFASFIVSLSFCRLLRPTSTVKPSRVVKRSGAETGAAFWFFFPRCRRIALLGELRADLVEIPFVFSQSQRFKNAVDIGQLIFCKLDLLRQFSSAVLAFR